MPESKGACRGSGGWNGSDLGKTGVPNAMCASSEGISKQCVRKIMATGNAYFQSHENMIHRRRARDRK
jgi:hypothetical protein